MNSYPKSWARSSSVTELASWGSLGVKDCSNDFKRADWEFNFEIDESEGVFKEDLLEEKIKALSISRSISCITTLCFALLFIGESLNYFSFISPGIWIPLFLGSLGVFGSNWLYLNRLHEVRGEINPFPKEVSAAETSSAPQSVIALSINA